MGPATSAAGELDRQLLVGNRNWQTGRVCWRFQFRLGRDLEQALLAQPGIFAAQRDQFVMLAPLDNSAMIEHENLVCAYNCRKPMRDHDRRTVEHQALERFLN